MRKLALAALMAGTLVACDRRGEVAEKRQELAEKKADKMQDVAEEASEEQHKVAKAEQNAAEEVGEAEADAQKEIADKEHEVAKAEQNAAKEVREHEPSGLMMLSGELKDIGGNDLEIRGPDGKDVELKLSPDSRLLKNGVAFQRELFTEGSQVRASYRMQDGDKVVDELELLDTRSYPEDLK
jgi:hypothetical protein